MISKFHFYRSNFHSLKIAVSPETQKRYSSGRCLNYCFTAQFKQPWSRGFWDKTAETTVSSELQNPQLGHIPNASSSSSSFGFHLVFKISLWNYLKAESTLWQNHSMQCKKIRSIITITHSLIHSNNEQLL